MERFDTGQMKPANKTIRTFIERSRIVKICLKVIGVFGMSFVLSGGLLYRISVVKGLPKTIYRRYPYSVTIGSRCHSRVCICLTPRLMRDIARLYRC